MPKVQLSSNLGQIQPLTVELGALECLEKHPIDLSCKIDVSMSACLCFIESSSELLVLKRL